MSVIVITGSSGLIGSEAVRFFHRQGFDVVGIDNNMRKYFFGDAGSVVQNAARLTSECPRFKHVDMDIRDRDGIFGLFRSYGKSITGVIHAASQPSHDWSAREPFTDFSINANGTQVLLEAVRQYCGDAVFIFTSTNKVYGDKPNTLPLIEQDLRWELDPQQACARHGFDESFSIDQSKHSLFGASKVAADMLVQEYGRYFGMKTGIFRCGCLTGPGHAGVELHGFLSYLVHCAVSGKPYTIYGYKGKQVRDNIHSFDLINAFWHFFREPRCGVVYNMGGSRHSNCSVLEAIHLIEKTTRMTLPYTLSPEARSGDHIWWISDVRKFQNDYPVWTYQYDLAMTIEDMVQSSQRQAAA